MIDGMDDLIGVLDTPLWEGEDDEFADWAHTSLGLPATFTVIEITPRAPSRRSAVSIRNDQEGAIVFAINPFFGRRKLQVSPIVMGPIVKNPDVIDRVRKSSIEEQMKAITALAVRHLPAGLVLELFTPEYH